MVKLVRDQHFRYYRWTNINYALCNAQSLLPQEAQSINQWRVKTAGIFIFCLTIPTAPEWCDVSTKPHMLLYVSVFFE